MLFVVQDKTKHLIKYFPLTASGPVIFADKDQPF